MSVLCMGCGVDLTTVRPDCRHHACPVDWVAKARALCDAATPGPWKSELDMFDRERGVEAHVWDGKEMLFAATIEEAGGSFKAAEGTQQTKDASFIATARTALPRALTALAAADALADEVHALGGDRLTISAAAALANYRKAREG